MRAQQDQRPASRPRGDGSRVTFQVTDHDRRVDCAISRAALQEISRCGDLAGQGLLECFLTSRERIEAIAIAKFNGRSRHARGILNIWSEDIDPFPPNIPAAACAAMPGGGPDPSDNVQHRARSHG